MKKLLALILSFTVILTLCTAASAESAVFVAPDGLDTNDGSISAPFATLQKAADEVSEGGTIYLREGTYSKGAILRHGVTIKPYNKEKVVFSAAQKVTTEPLTEEDKQLILNDSGKENAIALSGICNR